MVPRVMELIVEIRAPGGRKLRLVLVPAQGIPVICKYSHDAVNERQSIHAFFRMRTLDSIQEHFLQTCLRPLPNVAELGHFFTNCNPVLYSIVPMVVRGMIRQLERQRQRWGQAGLTDKP